MFSIYYRQPTGGDASVGGRVLLHPDQVISAQLSASMDSVEQLVIETTVRMAKGCRVDFKPKSTWDSREYVVSGIERVWSGGKTVHRYTCPAAYFHDLDAALVVAGDDLSPHPVMTTILANTPWREHPEGSRTYIIGERYYYYDESFNERFAWSDSTVYEVLRSYMSTVVLSKRQSSPYTVDGLNIMHDIVIDGANTSRRIWLSPTHSDEPPIAYVTPIANAQSVSIGYEDELNPYYITPKYGGTAAKSSSGFYRYGGPRVGAEWYTAHKGGTLGTYYTQTFMDTPGETLAEATAWASSNVNRLITHPEAMRPTATLPLSSITLPQYIAVGRNVVVGTQEGFVNDKGSVRMSKVLGYTIDIVRETVQFDIGEKPSVYIPEVKKRTK